MCSSDLCHHSTRTGRTDGRQAIDQRLQRAIGLAAVAMRGEDTQDARPDGVLAATESEFRHHAPRPEQAETRNDSGSQILSRVCSAAISPATQITAEHDGVDVSQAIDESGDGRDS